MNATQAPPNPTAYEPCEECGSPLDAQQRYCVECGARRGNGANPASRYFATMSKRSRRPIAGVAPKRPPSSRAAAVAFFALLPLAVALGLVVGRSGNDNGSSEGALLRALKQSEEKASTAGTTTATTQPTAAAEKPSAKAGKGNKKQSKEAKELAKDAKNGGKVVANTKNGTVHQVTGYKPPPKKVEEDTHIVEENPEQTGENYIKAQQNLPDVTVVGGEGEATSGGGAEP